MKASKKEYFGAR